MKLKAGLLLLVSLFVFLTGYLAFPIFSIITSSTAGTFTILNETAYLNWTNDYTFGVIVNSTVDNNIITILNSSSRLASNYSQSNIITSCTFGYYNLYVINSSGDYASTTDVLNTADTATMTLADFNSYSAGGTAGRACVPGRYSTTAFLFKNYTNSSENANISVIIDIPISVNNTLNAATHTGSFAGRLPRNATYYHSYFFNTSAIPNATSVTLNISGWDSTQNADLWLLSSGNLLAKSISQDLTDSLSYNYAPNAQMLEARIYGNSTSIIPYTGYVTYSTLNVTSSDYSQQISTIDFGTLNASGTNSVDANLKNEGNASLSGIALSSNAYRTARFSGSGIKSFMFLVADSSIDSSIHVSLNWTGGSNYTLNLYNPSGTLVTTSSNYYTNANISSVDQELFNDTSSIAQGYWNVTVISNSGSDQYNAIVFVYQAQTWISSNVTSITIPAFVSNTTQLNITIPNKTIDGNYEGKIFFTDANNGRVIIPYTTNVTVPTLVVQNATMSPTVLNPFISDIYRIDENVNSSITRTFSFNLTNIGTYDLIVNITNSSGILTCVSSSCRSTTASFQVNATDIIPSRSWQLINASVTFSNTHYPGNYDGWIFINATNSTNALSSHPYSTYNLSVRLNLTSLLYVQIPNILSNNGDSIVRNTSIGENVSAVINVSYINASLTGFGTPITTLPLSNFTAIWLQEKNVTTTVGKITNSSSGTLTLSGGTDPLFFTDNLYHVNFTIPANKPGGQYAVHVLTNYFRTIDSVSFSGEGINSSTLIINNTGLFMSSNTSGLCSFDTTCSASTSVNPNGTLTVYAKVANYGPLTATGATINITTTCNGYTISSGSSSGCDSASYSSPTWTLTVPAYNTSCVVSWVLTAGVSPAGAPSCAPAYLIGGVKTWFDPNGINLTVTVNNVTGTTTNPGTSPNLPGSSAAVYVSITSYPSIITIVQGSTNSTTVTVKNVNTSTTQDIGLSITNLTSSLYSISPTIRTGIVPLNSTNFTISFTIPNDTLVADYNAKFVASSNYGNDTKSFIVRIMPSNNTKIIINDTYQLYKLNYTNLYAEVNKSKASGMNTTLVEADLVKIKTYLGLVESNITAGDYFSAQQTLNQVKNLLEQAYTDYQNITGNLVSSTFLNLFHGNTFYIMLIVGAIAITIIAYLFWPTKEAGLKTVLFKPKVGQKSPEDSVWQKLKNKWEWVKLKKKWEKST